MRRKIALITTSPSFVQPFLRDAALHAALGIDVALAIRVHPSMRPRDRVRDFTRTVAREARLNATSFAAQLAHHLAFRPHARSRTTPAVTQAALATMRDGRAWLDVHSANDPRVPAALAGGAYALGVVVGADILTRHTLESIALPLYNLHMSDPAFARGKLPVFWEVHAGRDALTLTLHQLTAALDAGAVIHQHRVPISWHPRLGTTLRRTRLRITEAIAPFLAQALPAVLDGTAQPRALAVGPLRTTPTLAQQRAAARICRARAAAPGAAGAVTRSESRRP
jgi:folate-dependent phosphoribosylglycinamide formyltransferase PurN